MKMHLVALAGLAIGLAVPTLAQQKDKVDPQIVQQVHEIGMKSDEAFKKGDAAARAALFTEDAVLVTPGGLIFGRPAIEKFYADLFQKVHFIDQITKYDQNSPYTIGTAGNEVWDVGEFSSTIQDQNGPPIQRKGYFSSIKIRDGDTWKIRMSTYNITPPPVAPAETK
jgi:ketosteroid isomerase-like protein